MGDILQFPNKVRDTTLIELLVRALALNDNFLDQALGRGSFTFEEQDAIIDLLEANKTLLAEARRKP